jgi:hypothetical protein
MICRHEEAAKSAKFVLDNINSINLASKPNKSIMLAIRLLFEGMFHLLLTATIPEEMQDIIHKAHNLSVLSNGPHHRLTKVIEKCVLTFEQELK